MMFAPSSDFETRCAAYLFGCGPFARCAVIDARARDLDANAAFADSKGRANAGTLHEKPAAMGRILRFNQGRAEETRS